MGQKNTKSHGEEKLHPKTLYVHAKAAQQQREAEKKKKQRLCNVNENAFK